MHKYKYLENAYFDLSMNNILKAWQYAFQFSTNP